MSMSKSLAHARHEDAACLDNLLAQVDPPPVQQIELQAGRSLAITATPAGDRLEVRGRGGEVMLRIVLEEGGPVLRFESAAIEVHSQGDLSLRGRNVRLQAEQDLDVEVGATQHTRVAGASRLEAEVVELQANDGDCSIRAREDVKVDAERIGLNDNPMPSPFPWSSPAQRA